MDRTFIAYESINTDPVTTAQCAKMMVDLATELIALKKRETEIISELQRLNQQYTGPILDLESSIDELDLSHRTYCCILRSDYSARLGTINGILNFPKNGWRKICGFGPTAARDVEAKMHAAGYKDFKIRM